ncbi:hypothetical protein GCM10025783_30350 [Amnibacterium soli]|uniref:Cold-shock protein n=1 Tax=Amnibacterium soli TaxID=1282736 RepID=A0ABP8ZFU8_9MICO
MAYATGHATATVTSWSDDEGWGVVEAPGLPGGCWVHFSAIQGPGFHSLAVGSTVDIEWESTEQDGYHFRAVSLIA